MAEQLGPTDAYRELYNKQADYHVQMTERVGDLIESAINLRVISRQRSNSRIREQLAVLQSQRANTTRVLGFGLDLLRGAFQQTAAESDPWSYYFFSRKNLDTCRTLV